MTEIVMEKEELKEAVHGALEAAIDGVFAQRAEGVDLGGGVISRTLVVPPFDEAELEQLAGDLAKQGLRLAEMNEERLTALADDMERRLAEGEEILGRLEERRLRFEQLDPDMGAFQTLVLEDQERAGRVLDAVEREVLVLLVRSMFGLPLIKPSSDEALAQFGPACERLYRMGYLGGPSTRYKPVPAGMRLGVVLWGRGDG